MVAPFIVVGHERTDLPFKVTRQVIMFQENTIFHGTVPAFDFALGDRMIRLPTDVAKFVFLQPVLQFR